MNTYRFRPENARRIAAGIRVQWLQSGRRLTGTVIVARPHDCDVRDDTGAFYYVDRCRMRVLPEPPDAE